MQDCSGIPCLFRRGFEFGLVAFTGTFKLFCLFFQTRDRFTGIAIQSALSFDIMRELLDPVLKCFDTLKRCGLLLIQCIVLHLQPLEHGRGDRFFFTQRRKSGFGFFAQLCRFARGTFRLCGRCGAHPQLFFCAGAGFIRFFPAPVEQQAF